MSHDANIPGKRTTQRFLEDAQYKPLARECSKVGLRLSAMLTTAYSFAFRKGELLSLPVKQVGLASGPIRLETGTTKNGDGRVIKMTREGATLLTACVIAKTPDDFVFTRENGKPVAGFKKLRETVCCSSGVGKRVCRLCYKTTKQEAKESSEQIAMPPPIEPTGRRPERGRT
ncbi:MAG: tyrosine-type recombinase/integrase [Terriglobales bacterium]